MPDNWRHSTNDHQEVIVRWPSLPPTEDEAPRKPTAVPLLAALASGQPVANHSTESSIDHVVRSTIVRRVGGYPAWVLVGVATDEVCARWMRELRIALLFWLALAAGGGVLPVMQRRRERALAAILAQLDATRVQADAANRSKSMFLANMSHEIRTPLNGVLGFAQVGSRDPLTPEPARQRFGRILQTGKLLQKQLDDVLDVSRIEAGKLAPGVQAVDGQLVFATADTGCGLSASESARIFDAFEQADASVTRRHGGSGLGLTITRDLVGLMGGTIALASRPAPARPSPCACH